jgi:histo-blood group ABO system transferase
VLGDLAAVLHPGYAGRPPAVHAPYERRSASRAFVARHRGEFYFAGAFQGGRSQEYLDAMRAMRDAIDADAARGLTACWHDESHWNRYLVDHAPAVILPSTYCCPETWPMEGRRLLALDKNHAEVRT